jgi:hypothetical protein
VCWKPRSSCWSFHLLREEFLSAPIQSPLSGSLYRSFRVSELERDLGTATSDLATTSRQFSQVTNQLQVATEEAARLRDANTKLS